MKKNDNNFLHKFSFCNNSRFIILTILFVILVILVCEYCLQLNNFNNKSYNTYVEVSKVNYQVLQKDGTVINNLKINKFNSNYIKDIDFDLNYMFNSMKDFNGYFEYKVLGEVKILDGDNNLVYSKTYDLVPEQSEYITDNNSFNVERSITVDYEYLYNLINGFINDYGSNSTANYEISVIVNNKFFDKEVNNLEKVKLLINIPLNNGEVSISTKTIDNTDKYVNTEFASFLLLVFIIMVLIISVIVFILYLVYSIKQYKIEKNMNEYDKKIKRILDSYDRLIVNISVMPDLDDYKVNKIKEFKELLDVAENYNEPIRFIEVTAHKKANFIVRHKDEIFIYTVTNKK